MMLLLPANGGTHKWRLGIDNCNADRFDTGIIFKVP